MIEDELIKIWQSSPKVEQIKFEKSRLMIDMQSSLDSFHKAVKYRDLREIIPAIVMIPILVYITYTVPHTLSKIGTALGATWCIYLIFRLTKAKKHKPSAFSENYISYLNKTREYLIVQKQLLDTVIYWYILPSCTTIILTFLGFMAQPEKHKVSIGGITFTIAIGVFAYFLNKRAVKKQIIPRIKKIDELIKAMEE